MKTLILALALAVPASMAAQSPTAQPAATPAVSMPLGTRVGEMPTGYDDGGRRDPFAALVKPKRAGSPSADGRPRSGLAALALVDIVVKGIVKNGTVMLAILEVPGKQSFVARVKDRVLDASIKSIDAGGVVFSEDGGSGTTVDVRKNLRATGEEVR